VLLTGCAGSRTGFPTSYAARISFAHLRMASSGLRSDLKKNKRPMPYQSLEEEVTILRTKADKLRALATAHTTPLSPQLRPRSREHRHAMRQGRFEPLWLMTVGQGTSALLDQRDGRCLLSGYCRASVEDTSAKCSPGTPARTWPARMSSMFAPASLCRQALSFDA
jgi:hypothetical protein